VRTALVSTIVAAQPTPEECKQAGDALIEIAGFFDGLVLGQKDRVELVLAGLILRARRLVRAAYRMADADDLAEASPFIRGLMEYAVTLRWLLLDPPRNFTIWGIDDMRSRLVIAEGARRLADVEVIEPARRVEYEQAKQELEDEWREVLGDPVPKRMPSVETRARETGNQFLYEFAYRFESQTGVHPTAFAVDQMVEREGDEVRLSASPVRASYADPYGVAAVALLDMLDAAGEAVPAFDLRDQTAPHREVLHRLPSAEDK
jgi:hypothetical protein